MTKLNPSGSDYVFSTYFGSNDTRGFDIRVGESGHVYLVGATSSSVFPLVNPLQGAYSGVPFDGIVSRFLPDGSGLDFSTYLGGDGNDIIHTLALDNAGDLHFTGWSTSLDFPLADPLQVTPGGGSDLIVGTIAADLTALDFSTYLGGELADFGRSIEVGDNGHVHVTGDTASADFPTSDSLQPEHGGGTEAFVVTIEPGGGIACSDVEAFQARCNAAGTIQVRVTMTDGSHSGETVTIGVDGVPHVRTISGSVASYQEPGAGFGPHTITLDDPPACFAPLVKKCPVAPEE